MERIEVPFSQVPALEADGWVVHSAHTEDDHTSVRAMVKESLDEKVYARIHANQAAARRLDPLRQPVELIMSLETMITQAKKVEEICSRMRARAAALAGPRSE
jgi:hypothetical protein